MNNRIISTFGKMLAVTAALLLAVTNFPAQAAGRIDPVIPDEVGTLSRVGDVFYTHTYEQKLFNWKIGDAKLSLYCTLPSPPVQEDDSWFTTPLDKIPEDARARLREEVDTVVPGEGKLWGLNYYTGRYGVISEQGIVWEDQRLDTAQFLRPEENAVTHFFTPISFVENGKMYLFGENENHLGGLKDHRVLVSLDLQSGSMRVYDTKQPVTVCQEEPGFVLVVRKGKGKTQIISRLNLESGEMTDLPAVIPFRDRTDEGLDSLGGLAYRSDTKKIYFCFGKTLYELADDGQSFQAIREMPAESVWVYTACALQDDTYLIAMEMHLYHLPLYEK